MGLIETYVCAERHIYAQRDLSICKMTYTYAERSIYAQGAIYICAPTHMQRDRIRFFAQKRAETCKKEAYICAKRRISVQRNVFLCAPTHMQRDLYLHICREIYICAKIPIFVPKDLKDMCTCKKDLAMSHRN